MAEISKLRDQVCTCLLMPTSNFIKILFLSLHKQTEAYYLQLLLFLDGNSEKHIDSAKVGSFSYSVYGLI